MLGDAIASIHLGVFMMLQLHPLTLKGISVRKISPSQAGKKHLKAHDRGGQEGDEDKAECETRQGVFSVIIIVG